MKRLLYMCMKKEKFSFDVKVQVNYRQISCFLSENEQIYVFRWFVLTHRTNILLGEKQNEMRDVSQNEVMRGKQQRGGDSWRKNWKKRVIEDIFFFLRFSPSFVLLWTLIWRNYLFSFFLRLLQFRLRSWRWFHQLYRPHHRRHWKLVFVSFWSGHASSHTNNSSMSRMMLKMND